MTTTMNSAYLDQVPAGNTTLHTNESLGRERVIKCTATNDTTTSQTITFHKVESGGAVGDDRLILNAKILGSKETYECPEVVGQVLNVDMFISAIAGGADQITVALDVVEVV